MSIAALAWVFKQKIKPSWLKFTLVALADCVNDEGICWPSVKHLCVKTSQDRKTVLSNIAELERAGYLVDTRERRGRTSQVKVYKLTVPHTGLLNGPADGTIQCETVPSATGKSPVRDTKESRPRDTEPSRNRKEPLSESKRERLENMILSFGKIGNTAKVAKYQAELDALVDA